MIESPSFIEARDILTADPNERGLTMEFALEVHKAILELNPNTSLRTLFFSSHTSPTTEAGVAWYNFLRGLEDGTKHGVLTRALRTIALQAVEDVDESGEPKSRNAEIRDTANWELQNFYGRRSRPKTAAFLYLAFRGEDTKGDLAGF